MTGYDIKLHDQLNGGKKMQRLSRSGTLPILVGMANNHLRNLPLVVSFEVTLSCPANCRHCDTGGIKAGEKRLRPEEYRRYIEKLRPVFVQLSGGEPLLRPDLPEIVRVVKGGRRLPYVIVVSNGFLLNEKKYLMLKEAGADRFSISLDFPDERHDDFRRLPGLYAHLDQLIPRLAANGNGDVTINTAITSANLPVLRELADRAAEWGVAISYSAYSALRTRDPHYLISSREELATLKETIEDLIEIRHRQGTILNPSSVLRDTYRYFKEGGLPGCSAGRRFLVVRPDGLLNGCSMHRDRRYVSRQDLLQDFWADNKCQGCFVAIRAYTDKSLWSLAKDAVEAIRI
jgi:MoaA/NifB/PqqE/SkfB family radical SAM enzyme